MPEEKQRKMRFNIAFASPWEKNRNIGDNTVGGCLKIYI